MGQADDWKRKAEELKNQLGITRGTLGDLRKKFKPDPTEGKPIRKWIEDKKPKK